MSSDRVRVTEDVELGSYGAKWRHGWIPLNAAATALKAKRLKAGDKNHHAAEHHGGFTHIVAHSGSGTVHDSLVIGPDGKGHHAQFPTRAAAIADGAEHVAMLRGSHNAATLPRTKEQIATTHGDKKLVAHELSNTGKGEIRTEDGKIVSSNHVSKLAATKIVNAHNAGVRRRKFETKVDKAPSRR